MATHTPPIKNTHHPWRRGLQAIVAGIVLIFVIAAIADNGTTTNTPVQTNTPAQTTPAPATNTAACATLSADSTTSINDSKTVTTDSQNVVNTMNNGQDPTPAIQQMQTDLQTSLQHNMTYISDAQTAGAPASLITALRTYSHGLMQQTIGVGTNDVSLMNQGSKTIATATNQLTNATSDVGAWCSK